LGNLPQTWLVNTLAQTGGTYKGPDGKTYNFNNLGNVAQQSAVSNQMAQALLDIQNNYGPDFVKQRLADLQQSDPAGYAARQQLFDKIKEDVTNAPPNAKMASDLQSQVNSMLENAGNLDPQLKQQVQQNVRGGQVANGIVLGNAPASQEADALVTASDNLRNQQQQTAQNYLASGVTPEDIQYRKIQQDLSNLGAFQNNQTPEAQFKQLSGAGNGAAPFNTPNYQTPGGLNPNAGNIGQNFAQSIYGSSQQQANPFLAGASLATGAANIFSGLNKTGVGSWFNSTPSVPSYGGVSIPTGTGTSGGSDGTTVPSFLSAPAGTGVAADSNLA
jgi:hypothetical protein